MLRNKAVMVVVAVLFTMVVVYNLNFFLQKKRPVQPKETVPREVVPLAPEKNAESMPASTFQIPRDKEAWKRDPFQYTQEKGYSSEQSDRKVAKAGEINLQGITVRDGKYYALVNGWIVEAGDRLEDTTIVRITSESILVKDASGTREINIYNAILD